MSMTKTSPHCKYCGSSVVVKYGVYRGSQRYWCKVCRRKFADNKALPKMRVPANQIAAAMSMFYDGLSLKDVSRQMDGIWGVSPNKSTVWEWLVRFSRQGRKAVSGIKAQIGNTWVADEMVLKIRGRNYWLWDVMDAKTRFLLASHISPRRTTLDAYTVFRKAAQVAERPPRRVITDKLAAYMDGIERLFGSEVRHVQSQGIRAEVNNNLSERLQGTLRERTKVMRGLQSMKTAEAIIDGFQLHYNYFRPHESLGERTPAEAAKIEGPFKNWEGVIRSEFKPAPVFEDRTLKDTAFRTRRPRDTTFRDRSFRSRGL